MKDQKLKSYLDVASNVAVLLVALVILGNFAWVYLAGKPVPGLQSGLRKGESFSLIPGIDYSKNSQTLVIAMSSKCEYCNESISFFKQLLDANLENSNATRIVAVFPETAEEVWRYISEQQLNVNTIPGINFKALDLPGPPSAVLISNEGKVLNFWIGKPSKDAEKEMLDSIRHKTQTSSLRL
jgi:hypothetical protein